LTSSALAANLTQFTGTDRLFFYDSISPIVDAHTIDRSIAFAASRYDKSLDGTGDYLNCPFNKAQYEHFIDELMAAHAVDAHVPNDVPYFESCLPIEEIARRGARHAAVRADEADGVDGSRTGRRPYAAVQMRQEKPAGGQLQSGGLSESLKFGEQSGSCG